MIVSDEMAQRVKEQDASAIEVPMLLEVEELVIKLMPATPRVPSAGPTEQARRNAELRQRFLDKHEVLDAAAVSELSGSKSTNPRARASRWASEGRIFGVTVNGRALYPVFQFDSDGQPRPVVETVLEVLKGLNLSTWATAIWWDTGHDVLNWRTPAEKLAKDPEAVLTAARLDARTLGR